MVNLVVLMGLLWIKFWVSCIVFILVLFKNCMFWRLVKISFVELLLMLIIIWGILWKFM